MATRRRGRVLGGRSRTVRFVQDPWGHPGKREERRSGRGRVEDSESDSAKVFKKQLESFATEKKQDLQKKQDFASRLNRLMCFTPASRRTAASGLTGTVRFVLF